MKNIVLWVIGVAITLMSILFMILHFWSGLLILLSGLLLLPPISKTVNWTQQTKMWAFFRSFHEWLCVGCCQYARANT